MRQQLNLLRLPLPVLYLGLVAMLSLPAIAQTEVPVIAAEPAPESETTAPSLTRSQAQEQDLERRFPASEQRRLAVAGQAFLGLFLPAARPEPLGGVVLIAGRGEHADWPALIGPARVQLSAAGWHTLSISLPEPLPADYSLDEQAQAAREAQYLSQAVQRIQAARQVLVAEGNEEQPLPIVLLGRGEGALRALGAAADQQGKPPAALILYDLAWPAGDSRSEAALEQWRGPTYDIVTSASPQARQRTLAARRLGHEHYRQLIWLQSDNSDLTQQMLIKRLGGWLERALSETPDNA